MVQRNIKAEKMKRRRLECQWSKIRSTISRQLYVTVCCPLSGRYQYYTGDLSKLRWRRQRERLKSNRFYEQNKNSARASRFFVHFFAVPAQIRRDITKFCQWVDLRTWERERQGDKFHSLSLWTRTRSPLFSSDLTSLLSSNWVTWYRGACKV